MGEHRRRIPTTEQVGAERAAGGYATRCVCGHLWPCPAAPPHPEKILPRTMLPVVGGELDGMTCPLAPNGMAIRIGGGKLKMLPYTLESVAVVLLGKTQIQPYWRFAG